MRKKFLCLVQENELPEPNQTVPGIVRYLRKNAKIDFMVVEARNFDLARAGARMRWKNVVVIPIEQVAFVIEALGLVDAHYDGELHMMEAKWGE